MKPIYLRLRLILNAKLKGIEMKQQNHVNYLGLVLDKTMSVNLINPRVTDKFKRKNWFLSNRLPFFLYYIMP